MVDEQNLYNEERLEKDEHRIIDDEPLDGTGEEIVGDVARLDLPALPPPKPTVIIHALLIFIILLATYAFFFQGGRGNSNPQFALIHSIIERHRLDVTGYPTGADIVAHNGKLYSSRAPGNALIAVPSFFLFWNLLTDGLHVETWLAEHLAVYLATVATTSLFTALTAIMLYFVVLKISDSPVTALIAAFGFGLGTIIFPFATLFFVHPTGAFFCFSSFFLIFMTVRTTPQKPKFYWLLCAGFMSGYAVVTEHPAFLGTALITLYLFWILKNKLHIIWFILGGLLAAGILMGYNYLAFGDPFFLSYKAYTLSDSPSFAAHKEGFLGITFPKLDILRKITFEPQRGLFFYNPIMLGVFPGLYVLWKRKKYRIELALILCTALAFFLLNASYGDTITYWGGGASTGPRHVIDMLPFAMIPVSLFFGRAKILFWLLFIPSFFFMLLATSINPVIGYGYGNPIFQYLLPSFMRGELNIHQYGAFNNLFILEDSIAFNLGQLMRLKGTLSLIPLAAVWFLGLWLILTTLVRKGLIKSTSRFVLLIISFFLLTTMMCYPVLHQSYETRFIIAPEDTGLIGYYYKGQTWEGNPVMIRRDQTINFPWSRYEDLPLQPPFRIEWRGSIVIPSNGVYRFGTESDDGSWLFIDGEKIVDNGGTHANVYKEGARYLKKGKHTIRLQYENAQGNGMINLYWIEPEKERQVIPRRFLSAR